MISGCSNDDPPQEQTPTSQALATTAPPSTTGSSSSTAAPAATTPTTTAAPDPGTTPPVENGELEPAAAELRTSLSVALVEHVYLVGIAVFNAVNNPLWFENAVETLDSNSRDLAALLESVHGEAPAGVFLESWRAYVGSFFEYLNAGGAGDEESLAAALANLAEGAADLGSFFQSVGAELTADGAVTLFEPHVAAVTGMIDAVVAGEAEVFDLLRDAAAVMPDIATRISFGD